jgi:hypothetical protein
MIFIRIPSFSMKGMADIYAVDTSSFGGALSSAQCKEIEERVKATLNDKAKTFLTTVAGRLSSEAFKTSMSSVSSLSEAPVKHPSRSARLERVKPLHGDKDSKCHYSGHLRASRIFNEKLLWKTRHVCGGVHRQLAVRCFKVRINKHDAEHFACHRVEPPDAIDHIMAAFKSVADCVVGV